MEKRAILAFILCGLVIFIHMFFVAPRLNPPKTPQPAPADNTTVPAEDNTTVKSEPSTKKAAETEEPPTIAPPSTDNATRPAPGPTPAPPLPRNASVFSAAPPPAGDDLSKSYTVANELITSVWTPERSGACRRVTFRKFYETIEKKEPLTVVGKFDAVAPPAGGERRVPANIVLESAALGDALSQMTMHAGPSGDNAVVFTGRILREGKDYLEVVKTVSARPGRYELDVEIAFRNLSGEPIPLSYAIRAVEGIAIERGNHTEPAARVAVRKTGETGAPHVLEAKGLGALKKPDALYAAGDGVLLWAGLEDRYFAALLVTREPARMKEARVTPIKAFDPDDDAIPQEPNNLLVRVAPEDVLLAADGQAVVHRYAFFVGPKEDSVLDAHADLGFPQLLDYGWFGAISHLLIWLLKGFNVAVRNYGVAIILLTALVRVLLHPLTKKSQVAMHKMQKLRPKLQELQEKYKNDKQKLGQEQMKLFREAGASPFSGCLPILLQMPILIALFYALRLTFELRHAPFMLWIRDLSQPDTVGHFPQGIPLIGGAAVNILPLLMIVAMFLQQKMTPKPEDPQSQQQQKFFMFFPLLMGFLFWGFPSGLTLYWFTSTLIGMGEQAYIKRHLAALPDVIPGNGIVKKKAK